VSVTATTTTGEAQMTHRQILLVFSGLMLGMLLAALDQTIVATALPTMVGELGGLQHLSWVITAYLLTSTASGPLYGKLSDLYGRKILFQAGIVIFLVGSVLSGLSQSMLQLITFRALQGLGAGGLMVLAQAIIGDILSPRERGRYQGYIGSVFAFASVAGPLLGGLFVDHLSWRWVFYVNIPIGIVALFVTSAVLKLPARQVQHKIDYLGSALMVSGIGALLLMTSWGGSEYAWSSPVIIGLAIAGPLLLIGFLFQEQRAEEPLLPLRLFREGIFSISSSIGFIIGFALFGAIAFMPLYFQVVNGDSATGSGLRMVPMMFGIVLTSIASGRLISKTGRYRAFPIVGTAIMSFGVLLLTRLTASTSLLEASLYILVLGVGVGMVMQVVVLAVQNAVPYRDLGISTAGVNLFRSLGSAFGVAIFGSILTNRLDTELPRHVPADALVGIDPAVLTGSPERLKALPLVVHQGVSEAFAISLHTVFIWALPVAVVGFGLTWFLKETPLRDTVHVGGAAAMEGAGEVLGETMPHPGHADAPAVSLVEAESPRRQPLTRAP
jgi:EmrB/QacA subfamily drug resistance transporter